MPEKKKPRAGSLQYWPRKRARSMYPPINNYPESADSKPLAFMGYKVGMTQVRVKDTHRGSPTQGQIIPNPVTIIETPSLFLLGVRAYISYEDSMETLYDVYASKDKIPKKFRDLNINYDKKLKDIDPEEVDELRLIVATQPDLTGIGKKKPEKFEIGLGGSLEDQVEFVNENLAKEINVGDVFEDGDYSDIISVTKGKGFQGVVKRYGVKVRGRKDEQHSRQIGVIGTEGEGRVKYTVPQPGRMGFHRRSEYNKRILQVSEDSESVNPEGGFKNYGLVKSNFVIIKGSVPGSSKRPVFLRKPIRKHNKKYPVEIKEIKTDSHQGD
ncbi:MAG: 50S ribosomal protein L3 [Candidatus Aenigmatarchaeota archaeon]